MPELHDLLERRASGYEPPSDLFDRVFDRRRRRDRNRRIGSAVLVLALAAAGIGTLVRTFSSSTIPASDPSLGIFEPAAGRIVYVNEGIDLGYGRGLWAVDPSGPTDTTEGPSVTDDVASTLVRLGPEDALPLGWSSDGTELLLMRSVGDSLLPEQNLSILHADGSETRVNKEPMGISGAAISPDGTRVVFAGQYDLSGLYVLDAEGGRPAPLPIPQAVGGASDPTFSPDGRQIAYLAGNVEAEVWVANADGTDAHEILADEPTEFRGVSGPVWSPAGDRLAIGLGANEGGGRPAIYTFAPDGSDFTQVISGGSSPYWSPDGTRIAFTISCDEHPDAGSCPEGSILRSEFDPQPGDSPAGLAIADADGSDVRAFGFAASGPWHPVPPDEATPSPAPSEFVGTWTSTELEFEESSQTMTIRAAEDGAFDISLHDASSSACSTRQTRTNNVSTPASLTGRGRLENATTLVVPSPAVVCLDGREPIETGFPEEEAGTSYTVVLDLATGRLFDNLGVAWHRGAAPENATDATADSSERTGPGTFSFLGGEVTFRAEEPWTDHIEAYIDPRLFFLIGTADDIADGEQGLSRSERYWQRFPLSIEILANPLPEASCASSSGVPGTSEEVVRAIRSNPDLESTAPVTETVGGLDALRLDVAAAPGADACVEAVPVVTVASREAWGDITHDARGRLYVLDLPGGSARALAIWVTAPNTLFEQAVEAAQPVVDSFEFHAG